MEATSPAGEPSDLKQLSDEELINLLPVRKHKKQKRDETELRIQERQALDELWKRHYETVKDYLHAKIFASGSTLCPPQEPDKEHFLQMSLNEAYPAFLRRIWRREFENFGGFLYTLALKVALDVRRQLTHRRAEGEDEEAAPEGEEQPSPPVEMVPLNETALLVDEGRKPPQIVAARELRELMKLVLIQHAKESPESALSAKVVCSIYQDELTWKDAAEFFLPEEIVGRSLRTRIRMVKGLEEHNVLDLCRRLRELGVADADAFEF